MEQFVSHLLLAHSQGTAAYVLVFGILVLCGLGVPVPEDVVLIMGGYLSHSASSPVPLMIVLGFGGILAGDSVAFTAGRLLGNRIFNLWPFRLLLTPSKRRILGESFEDHGMKIVMTARFMPGVRTVTYFSAGSHHMRFLKFLGADALAALISAPLFVLLGYHFADRLDQLFRWVKRSQTAALGVLATAVALFFLLRWLKRRWSQVAQGAAAPVPVSLPGGLSETSKPSSEHDQQPPQAGAA